MLIRRNMEHAVKAGAEQMPVVAVIGPRQSGKSTLVKKLFARHVYLDMQDAELLDFAQKDPKGFLNSYQNEHGIIIDEAQYAPALFSQIKVEADKNPKPGYYILSGSQNFLLYEKISESLAGRVYFYTLLPFCINELQQADLAPANAVEQMCKGFYPRVYQPYIRAQEYYENYLITYVERDIRAIRNIDNILLFKKFIQLCALRIGSTLNYVDLARDCGISVMTAHSWLALLQTSFILFLLPPYHNNLGKRIIKSPKLFFYDVGLAATLMGLDAQSLHKNRALYGALFENMVITEYIKNFNGQNIHPTLSFYRDTNQREIDLIIETKGLAIPIEIKSSETADAHFFDTPAWFIAQSGSEAEPIVVYGGMNIQKRSQGTLYSWQQISKATTLLLRTE